MKTCWSKTCFIVLKWMYGLIISIFQDCWKQFFHIFFFACLCNSQLHWMSSGTLRSHHAVINPIWSCGVFSVCSRALLKQRVLVKARLGESLLLDMQRFTSEGETVCAQMWRRAALCAKDKRQRLSCYQNAITALQVKAALTSWAL